VAADGLLALKAIHPTPRRPLPVLGQPVEASRVLPATGALRAQPGQSELPTVGRF
jgi:hypothetical protein